MAAGDPRSAALRVLNRYRPRTTNLSEELQRHLRTAGEGADRALVRDLVWGTVRRLNSLDFLIDSFTERPAKLEPVIRNVLRLGIFQALYSERIPEYAAVNETVRLARSAGRPFAAGLVNGVLRSVLREKDRLPWPDRSREPGRYLALTGSHPGWLVERWRGRWGDERAADLCRYNNSAPSLTIRVNTLKITRPALKERLAGEGVESRETAFSSDGLELLSKPELEKLAAYREGLFLVQDEASQLVAALFDPVPGALIVDLCAGAGIKSTHLAQRFNGRAKIIAVDASPEQKEKAAANFARLGILPVEYVIDDARAYGAVRADAVLIDAPCSGLGTVRRKPDIKWNRNEEDVTARYPALQAEILSHAATLVKDGGYIVYSTCTTEPEENETVVESFLSRVPGYEPERIGQPFTSELLSDDGIFFRSFPHKDGMDGFFAARLRKTGRSRA